jgi:hypothetical protein
MKSRSCKQDALLQGFAELEATCRLWIMANAAKEERIRELQVECNRLRLRVARLSRQAGRRQKLAVTGQVRFAR